MDEKKKLAFFLRLFINQHREDETFHSWLLKKKKKKEKKLNKPKH